MKFLCGMEKHTFKPHWYLGFLGLIGFFKLELVLSYFESQSSFWVFTHLLWFLWFDYFIPVRSTKNQTQTKNE